MMSEKTHQKYLKSFVLCQNFTESDRQDVNFSYFPLLQQVHVYRFENFFVLVMGTCGIQTAMQELRGIQRSDSQTVTQGWMSSEQDRMSSLSMQPFNCFQTGTVSCQSCSCCGSSLIFHALLCFFLGISMAMIKLADCFSFFSSTVHDKYV